MKLVDIPVIYICPDHNNKYSERKQYTQKLLEGIGFKSITHYKSGSQAYPTCLAKANIDILENNLNDEPFILLEDDCEPFLILDGMTEITFPEDTDAFYLGFSKYGGSKTRNHWEGNSVIEKYSPTYIRILNMLTTHAILYKSRRYKEIILQTMKDSLVMNKYHTDVLISRIQPCYRVYGYYYPFFYQSPKFGNQPSVKDATCFTFLSYTKN
jgi:hypothetical protein